MSKAAYIQLAIFYGGLSVLLAGALLYALRVSRQDTRAIPITNKVGETGSTDVLNRELYFELTDRAHVASIYVQMALGGHPVLTRHPELMALYQEAVDKLEGLYQASRSMDKP